MLALVSLDAPTSEPTEEQDFLPLPSLFNTTDVTDCCCNTWELVYQTDASQNVIYGSLTDLINAIESGADVKVNTWIPDTIWVNNGHVYAQQTKQLGTNLNQGNNQYIIYPGYWYFTVVKTDGTYDAQRYYINGDYLSETQSTTAVKWFVKY